MYHLSCHFDGRLEVMYHFSGHFGDHLGKCSIFVASLIVIFENELV